MPSQRTLDVQTFLNTHPMSAFQWRVIAMCFCVVLLDGFDTAAIGYIAPSLLKEWGIGKPALAPVLSAALFGLAAGALAAGPLSDRFGRKRLLVVSVLLFGITCLASALSGSLHMLVALRFLTGLGLGAAMPNAVTLVSEFCPDSRRATVTNAMFCGFPLGASLGGFLAAWMIPLWGWRSVLVLGGLAPLLLVVILALLLPESVRFLVARSAPEAAVRRVLARIGSIDAAVNAFRMHEQPAPASRAGTGRGGIAVVLSPAYRTGSMALWLAYFMGLVIFYSLINWMPVLFKDAGLDARTGTLIAALFPLGGVGAILFGWLMDRFNANKVIAIGFVLTAAAIWSIGQVSGNLALLVAVVFLAGAVMNTAQSSLPALAAAFYPTEGRATGVSWMLGIGRFGGIAGSFLVAELTARHLDFSTVFAVVAVPGVIAALALVFKQYVHPELAAAVRQGVAAEVMH